MIARQGYNILDENDNVIGHITSGGFSPSLEKGIAMGYIMANYSDRKNVKIEIRKKKIDAVLVDFPFLKK